MHFYMLDILYGCLGCQSIRLHATIQWSGLWLWKSSTISDNSNTTTTTTATKYKNIKKKLFRHKCMMSKSNMVVKYNMFRKQKKNKNHFQSRWWHKMIILYSYYRRSRRRKQQQRKIIWFKCSFFLFLCFFFSLSINFQFSTCDS